MYQAYVLKITNVQKHPNADRLQIGQVSGYTVVVGLDVREGDYGIFFPADGQLSEEYCRVNNLIGYIDENGNRQGGFFDEKRKVRAQKFRGIKSEGYFAPLNSVMYTGISSEHLIKYVKEFTELNGHQICQRYETEQTRKAAASNKQQARKVNTLQFPKHVDTAQFMLELDNIPVGCRIYISEKQHGTSHRQGKVWVRQNLSKWKTLINKGFKIIFGKEYFPQYQYEYLIGTRNTVLGDNKPDWYDNDAFRYNVAIPQDKIPNGMVVYGEIVGHTSRGQLIMPAQNTEKTKDKTVQKLYGKEMKYIYGCNPGECQLYLYRILVFEKDGRCYEFDHNTMVNYAETMLNAKVVPLLHPVIEYDGNKEALKQLVESLADGPSTLDGSHIREGVVLRLELPNGSIRFLKYKSFLFRVLENIAKEDDNYIDTEEAN